jgi:hypothetical protein
VSVNKSPEKVEVKNFGTPPKKKNIKELQKFFISQKHKKIKGFSEKYFNSI